MSGETHGAVTCWAAAIDHAEPECNVRTQGIWMGLSEQGRPAAAVRIPTGT